MRYHEIIGQEIDEAAANLPHQYMIDPETDLALNPPNQWSESPYLGAVRNNNGPGYVAQIHMPQADWEALVNQNPGRWSRAPKSFFEPSAKNRPAMRVAFRDPRQAAWFWQEVRYGGDHDPKDYFGDYFDRMYNDGDAALVGELKSRVPTFSGEALTSEDESKFFASKDDYKKQVQSKKNASEYEGVMVAKIRKALLDFYAANRALAKKRLGSAVKSLQDIAAAVDRVISQRGVDYFVTTPGGVKLKDVASLQLA